MKKYKVHFEIFSQKCAAHVYAKNEKQAKKRVADNIFFKKVEELPDTSVEDLAKMMGIKL